MFGLARTKQTACDTTTPPRDLAKIASGSGNPDDVNMEASSMQPDVHEQRFSAPNNPDHEGEDVVRHSTTGRSERHNQTPARELLNCKDGEDSELGSGSLEASRSDDSSLESASDFDNGEEFEIAPRDFGDTNEGHNDEGPYNPLQEEDGDNSEGHNHEGPSMLLVSILDLLRR